jgi:N-acyl-L-homoserine lactone synthetase
LCIIATVEKLGATIMQTAIITWRDIHEHGDLWWQHLKLRKTLFVDQMQWGIPHTKEAEWDQYDTAATVYIVTHDSGSVLAASRMLPTTHESGGWSYMIRDAALGRLPGIAPEICATPPQCPTIWEATRFTVNSDIADPKERNTALQENAKELARYAANLGAQSLIAMMKPAFIRWLRSIDLPTSRLGPNIVTPESDKVCAMQMDLSTVRQTVPQRAA